MTNTLRTVIIPAAGKGTRLLPLTRVTAKELLPVFDEVAINFSMQEAVAAGAERIIVVVSPTKMAIRDFLSADDAYAIQSRQRTSSVGIAGEPDNTVAVEFVVQETANGLGDALLCCKGKTLPGPFGVILPDDVIFGADCLSEMAEDYKGGHMVAAMQVTPAEASRYGIFHVKSVPSGRCVPVSGMVEKPTPGTAPSTLAAVGRYILDPMIFDVLAHTPPGAGGEVQLTDALAIATNAVPLTAFRFSGDRYDCGNHEGLLAASLARQSMVLAERRASRRQASSWPAAGLGQGPDHAMPRGNLAVHVR